MPVSDGGDGLLDALTRAGFTDVPVVASGPTGVPGKTRYVRRGTEAVIVEKPEKSPAPAAPGGGGDMDF